MDCDNLNKLGYRFMCVQPFSSDHSREKTVSDDRPLVVDLDGTLIRTNLLYEGVLRLLAKNPLLVFSIVCWVLRGKAHLKHQVAQRATVDPTSLPYNEKVAELLRCEHERGREIYLATAAARSYAQSVADHLGLFSGVVASDGNCNCSGVRKLEAIRDRLGRREFIFIGNDLSDLPVFRVATCCALVNPSGALRRSLADRTPRAEVVRYPVNRWRDVRDALRCHQWVKNLLVFLPAVASHEIVQPEKSVSLVTAFAALCFSASSLYLINDAFDLPSDRLNSAKRRRPLASGRLTLPCAALLLPLMISLGLLAASQIKPSAALLVGLYVVVSVAYTFRLKRILLADVITLTGLYLLRMAIGNEAAGIRYSFWFLMFFGFLFGSLSLLKRYNEVLLLSGSRESAPGRAYRAEDAETLRLFGVSCGVAAIVILALYINSAAVRETYSSPEFLAVWCPVLFFALTRLWILARRSELDQDPVLFVVADPVTYLLLLLGGAAFYLAI